MGERITRKNLDGMAETLTRVMRRAGVIEEAQHVRVSGAYGGWAFHVTGGTLGSAVSSGVAGLGSGHDTARATWERGAAVIGALSAVNARTFGDAR